MKVGFATVDWSRTMQDANGVPVLGGSGHIRIGQYLPHLTMDHVYGAPAFDWDKGVFGVHLLTNTEQFTDPDDLLVTDTNDDDFVWDCDIIYLQRNMHISMPDAIIEARSNGQIVINDVDDWYWGLHKDNQAYWSTDPDLNWEYNRAHYKKALEVSSAVVVSTPFLRDRISQWNPRTYTLENHIDIEKFDGDSRFSHDAVRKFDTPEFGRVGWTGSTAHRSGDLRVLRPFANQFEWTHLGHHEDHPFFTGLVGVEEAHTLGMAEYSEYAKRFEFDIGVVPLSKNPFNDAKSAIKGMEYAAAGVPFVASVTDQYTRLRDFFGVGITARGTHDWIRNLKRLSASPYLRAETAEENWHNLQRLGVSHGAMKLEELLTI
jgi:hypothetical protein